jgi:hypothetical protein
VTPPLLGSALYRGSFLSAYEFGFTFIHLNTEEDHFLKQEYLGGTVRPLVPLACMLGAVVRGTIEGRCLLGVMSHDICVLDSGKDNL